MIAEFWIWLVIGVLCIVAAVGLMIRICAEDAQRDDEAERLKKWAESKGWR